MSKENVVNEHNEILVFLDPSQIVEPDVTNVRPWSSKVGDTEAEIKKIEALAATIEEEGQLQPVKVRKLDGDGGMYELIIGRRRKKAIELINAGKKTGEEMKVKAVVSDKKLSDPSAFRQAAIENWHREGLSPMDMYMDIATVRENFKWQGSKGTKKVAEFFKVSPATVTQYETLGKLPEDVQTKVHTGELSRDDAFKLAVIAEKKGPDAAKQVADEAEAKGAEAAEEAEAKSAAKGKTSTGAKAKKAAKTKVIKKAAREADPDKPQPRSKKEIIEYFEAMLGPVYGHPNGAVHMFVKNFVLWCAGEIQERTLDKYWDALVEKAAKGTPEPIKKDEEKKEPVKKSAKKK